MCAEFGVHESLPIYSGGLGILAGDVLKEASDLGVAMVGVGLMYRTGYFHQRVDTSGYQHEYWIDTDPQRLPAALVTGTDGHPLEVTVPVFDIDLVASVWRVDVGNVALYLLDTDRPDNPPFGRWVTSRLYDGNRLIRLAQYAVLGVGGVRALRAMGITPSVHHLNEGHPALASWELLAQQRAAGASEDEAWQAIRGRFVFTTHTPVAAGNETYDEGEITLVLGRLADIAGGAGALIAAGRPAIGESTVAGLTPLAMRASRSVNGVSRRHGEVSRAMWQGLWPGAGVDDVPITAVTNGVHVPSWLSGAMRELLDEYLGRGWLGRADDPATWAAIDGIPDAELWAARCENRRRLVEHVRVRSALDRLRRGEQFDYAEAADHLLDPHVLTLGFARRIASYKRLHLLVDDPGRALGCSTVTGRCSSSSPARRTRWTRKPRASCATCSASRAPRVWPGESPSSRTTTPHWLREMVSGCDVWINVPRPPQEASGTSGMKAAVNGVINLSVLDGWWAEAYDGTNGWAIDGDLADDDRAQDHRHAQALLDILEHEAVPLFHERDDAGVPVRWVQMVKRSMMTNGPRFSATRMLREYVARIYGHGCNAPAGTFVPCDRLTRPRNSDRTCARCARRSRQRTGCLTRR